MAEFEYLAVVTLGLMTLLVIRLAFVLPALKHHQLKQKPLKSMEEKSIMVLLGSGGHTGEMIRILSGAENLKKSQQLYWVISSGDSSSAIHLEKFQIQFNLGSKSKTIQVPRARRVGEGLISSIQSTLKTILSTFIQFIQLKAFPDVLIVNGPATAVPTCYFFFVLRFFGLNNTKILYIESLARVDDLSLSGKLCYLISDRFFVQWQKLQVRYPNTEWYGILV